MPKLRRLENRSDGCPAGAVIWCEQHAYDRYIRRKSAEPVDDTEPLTWPPSDAGKLEPDDVENFRTLSTQQIIDRGRTSPTVAVILPEAVIEPPEEQVDCFSVDRYGDGYMLCDYSGNRGEASFCGLSMQWRNQPNIDDPFPTEQAAKNAWVKDLETEPDAVVHEPNDDPADKPTRKSKPGKRANRTSR